MCQRPAKKKSSEHRWTLPTTSRWTHSSTSCAPRKPPDSARTWRQERAAFRPAWYAAPPSLPFLWSLVVCRHKGHHLCPLYGLCRIYLPAYIMMIIPTRGPLRYPKSAEGLKFDSLHFSVFRRGPIARSSSGTVKQSFSDKKWRMWMTSD